MKRYKLIKKYDGSPKLGTIIIETMIISKDPKFRTFTISGHDKNCDMGKFRLDNPEISPEFWEEIIDKNPLKLEVGKTYKLQYIHCESPIRICKITRITKDGYPWMETSQYNGIVGSDCYRLIKEVVEYPIGTKVEDNRINKTFTKEVDGWYTSSKTGHTDKSISNAKHIKVLEEIIEKDYEILSLITNNKTILNTPFLCVDDLLKNQGCSIHSIKRLSDSEVFTIKDHARPKRCNPNAFTITGFTLDCNNEHMLALGGNGGISINKLKPVKKPLFTTFDNVNIYEGDDLFWLHKKTNSIGKWIWNNYNTNLNDARWLFFSTRQDAQDYITLNEPCLSMQDLKITGCLNEKQWFAILDLVKHKSKL